MRRGYVARDSPSLVVVLVVVVVAAMVVVVVEGLSPATVVALAPSLSLSTSSWPSFEARATTFFVVTSSRRSRLLLGDGGAIEGGRGRSSTRGWGGGVVGRLSRLVPPPPRRSRRGGRTTLLMAGGGGGREDEIRRKIAELRREGKLKKKDKPAEGVGGGVGGARGGDRGRRSATTAAEDYAEKLGSKLGGGGRRGRQLGRMLGVYVPPVVATSTPSSSSSSNSNSDDDDDYDDDIDDDSPNVRRPRLGKSDYDAVAEEGGYDDDIDDDDDYYEMTEDERREQQRASMYPGAASEAINAIRRNVDNDDDDDDDIVGKKEDEEMDEEDMVNAVARALYERGGFRSAAAAGAMAMSSSGREDDEDDEDGGGAAGVVSENVDSTTGTGGGASSSSVVSRTASAVGPRTSGVGGSWSPPPAREGTEDGGGGGGEDAYQPKVGTWGAFPRPKNISVAYGGGKRVGAGIKTDEKVRQQSIDDTKERLRAYREKMGIEVQSEKDHVDVIEEALALAGRAMQRGSYGAGVSALEKVTRYCSTRSKLGGKVFLELAMAYEAEGRTDQAIGLYAALTKSPIEEVKSNADKLLYGLEAMNFMRNEAKLEDFSRKKVAETFIETTGFNDISKNFDKVYNTAYIDLDKGGQYYRMLTANAVRSTREARQILLRAVSSGEVENMKVVQAVRSITRSFDEAVTAERKDEEANNVPVDYAGKPIVSTVRRRSTQDDLATAIGMDGYVLSKPSQTLDNLDGEWRLQLMADKRGDRVEYFNSTLFWQRIDSSEMKYAGGSGGIRSSSQSGVLDFDEAGRILSRAGVSTNAGGGGGGGMGLLSMIMGGGGGGTAREMIKAPQQVMLVDSALLVTRAIVKAPAADNVKDYFSVWRRVESGTYSGGS